MDTRPAIRHNLPPQPTSFIGREAEIKEIAALLANPDCRLLTLVGSGGIGKTRLAIEVAAHKLNAFADGVFFVPLQPLTSPENIVPTIAASVGYQFQPDERDPHQQLLDYFSHKSMLLLMDNFEHLLEGVDRLSGILAAAPYVKILATSRTALRLREEQLYPLLGLAFPMNQYGNGADDFKVYSAITLFGERAHRVQPGFSLHDELSDVARICKLVEGMPLAIELAAPWVKMLASAEIADEIQRSLDILTTNLHDMPERHRSIRAVFDWSWNLLSDDEQATFRKLTIFRGGFTRDAAQTVIGVRLDTLLSLIDRSLIRHNRATGRYEVHELLRQYGAERLENSGKVAEVADAHMQYYADLLHQLEADLKGQRQIEALDEIASDFENVRASWKQAARKRAFAVVDRSSVSLDLFCTMRNRHTEGAELFELARECLAPAPGERPHPTWGKVLVRHNQNDNTQQQIEKALSIARTHQDLLEIGYCLFELGVLATLEQEFDRAISLQQESLATYRKAGDHFHINRCLGDLTYLSAITGQHAQCELCINELLRLIDDSGDKAGTSAALNHIATWSGLFKGDFERAEHLFGQAIVIARQVGNRWQLGWNSLERAWISLLMGNIQQTQPFIDEGLQIGTDLNSAKLIGFAQWLSGIMANLRGDYSVAWNYCQDALINVSSAEQMAWASLATATAACGLGEFGHGAHLNGIALQFAISSRITFDMILTLPVSAVLLAQDEQYIRAVETLGLAFNHSVSPRLYFQIDPLISHLRRHLEAELGEEVYNAAWERGKSLDLVRVVQRLSVEFSRTWETAPLAVLSSASVLAANHALTESLTKRELEVLALICAGLSNREIAECLYVSVNTLKTHISHVYSKLSINNRQQAIHQARKLGLVPNHLPQNSTSTA